MWFVTHNRDEKGIAFLGKRIVRVVPAYWIVTLSVALMVYLAPHLFKSTTFDVAQILKSLFFLSLITVQIILGKFGQY